MITKTSQCNICGWSGEFLQQERGREGWLCGNCSASSRLRMVAYALGKLLGHNGIPVYSWPEDKTIAVLESSTRGPYPMMFKDKFDYYATEYDPDKIAAGKDTRAYADFQNLHYQDSMFDVVIASDVFEHVRDDEAGFKEIFRTLKSGGSLLLTVPYDHTRGETIKRVDTTGEKDVHILEPEYHGGGGHTLTYRNYGRDLLTMLHRVGFSVGHLETNVEAHGIPRQDIIIARKGEFVELLDVAPPERPAKSIGFLLPFRLFLLYKYNLKGFIHYLKEVRRG